jgi:hypothetical protein
MQRQAFAVLWLKTKGALFETVAFI